jgi:hypothetical protein
MNIERPSSKENKEKRPEDVIGFLRSYNFGSRNEPAEKSVQDVLTYLKGNNPDDKEKDPDLEGLLIKKLENSGFSTKEGLVQALWFALADFENHPEEWQDEKSQAHENWGHN